MKCKGMRHVGIEIDIAKWTPTIDYYEALGFVKCGEDIEIIDGVAVGWQKLTDGIVMIEFIRRRESHLAFEVDEIDKNKYYYVTPAGHLVQFDRDPSGNLVEFVELKKEE